MSKVTVHTEEAVVEVIEEVASPYYIAESDEYLYVFNEAGYDAVGEWVERHGDVFETIVMQNADIVIKKSDDIIVKCRWF